MKQLFLSFWVVIVCCAGGHQAFAQQDDPEPILQQAEALFEELEYEAALKAFISVIQMPNATEIQRARAFLYMGVCFTALGNAENAVLSFVELLKLKPDFRIPEEVSPAVKEMFKEALSQANLPETPPPGGTQPPAGANQQADAPPVELEVEAPKKTTAGKPVDLAITVLDPEEAVEDVVILWRRVGKGDFSTIRVKYTSGQKKVEGRIPGAVIGDKPGELKFYVEAKGEGGKTVGQAGTAETPRKIALTAPPKGESNWGWYALGIGGGLVVAGGIVAAILLTQGSDDPGGDFADVSIVLQ